jgi:hypothetical protein
MERGILPNYICRDNTNKVISHNKFFPMKSIQNLLRSSNDQSFKNLDLTQIKGGNTGNNNAIILETMVEVTCVTNGTTSVLFCDRRRKRIGG